MEEVYVGTLPSYSDILQIVGTCTGKDRTVVMGEVSDGQRRDEEGHWSNIPGLLEDSGVRVKTCGAFCGFLETRDEFQSSLRSHHFDHFLFVPPLQVQNLLENDDKSHVKNFLDTPYIYFMWYRLFKCVSILAKIQLGCGFPFTRPHVPS